MSAGKVQRQTLKARTQRIFRAFADAAMAWGFVMDSDNDRAVRRALQRYQRQHAAMFRLLLRLERRVFIAQAGCRP